MPHTVRPPACAGRFYPADTDELEATVRAMLDSDGQQPGPAADAPPKALIGPHAGYVFSGEVAGHAYRTLKTGSDTPPYIERVVLAGPSHFVQFDGIATSPADAFRTPLGDVPVARELADRLIDDSVLRADAEPHAREHSLETHLPFLQMTLDDFAILPVLTGDRDPAPLVSLFDKVWGDEGTLIAVSSDLSHYLDYETARAVDRQTCQHIEARDPDALQQGSACGRTAIRALLQVANRHDLQVRTLDLRNSGDTAGDRDQVVGYGAWALSR